MKLNAKALLNKSVFWAGNIWLVTKVDETRSIAYLSTTTGDEVAKVETGKIHKDMISMTTEDIAERFPRLVKALSKTIPIRDAVNLIWDSLHGPFFSGPAVTPAGIKATIQSAFRRRNEKSLIA